VRKYHSAQGPGADMAIYHLADGTDKSWKNVGGVGFVAIRVDF
jgi:hypothetical protein